MPALPSEPVDTVIVGNGPAALILSYILHGHIPYYTGGLDDHLIDSRLRHARDLTRLLPATWNLVRASSRYSSQALPVNALLDGLIRPNGDTEVDPKSLVEWRYQPDKSVSHIVLGNTPSAGGQWAANPVKASGEIETLSYAEQLNLPGYSFADYWTEYMKEPLPEMTRPTRNNVAGYLRAYPTAVHINDAIHTSANITNISRSAHGFHVQPFDISCKHIVLASGVFHVNLPAPSFLTPLKALHAPDGPVLVIGSGFTAADIIISTPPHRKIIHLFHWDPINNPSPLRACHGSAYPDYAWIYRQMKLAAEKTRSRQTKGPLMSASSYISGRNWEDTYEGFPNSRVISMDVPEKRTGPQTATVELGRFSQGNVTTRTISSFEYATGRRGSLAYLDPPLLAQVLSSNSPPISSSHIEVSHGSDHFEKPTRPPASNGTKTRTPQSQASPPKEHYDAPKIHDFGTAALPSPILTRQTMRAKIEQQAEAAVERSSSSSSNDNGQLATETNLAASAGLEVAPDMFAIGSITGDTLIRFAYGGVAVVAGALLQRSKAV